MSGVGLGGVATILGAYYENEKKRREQGDFTFICIGSVKSLRYHTKQKKNMIKKNMIGFKF